MSTLLFIMIQTETQTHTQKLSPHVVVDAWRRAARDMMYRQYGSHSGFGKIPADASHLRINTALNAPLARNINGPWENDLLLTADTN